MPTKGTDQITMRLGELQDAYAERFAEPSAGAIRRELSRYYVALAAELRTVTLSTAEASLIVDALNGTIWEPAETIRLLWASVDDAMRLDGLTSRWRVDGPALVEKLRGLTFAQSLAVVDAAERYWRESDEDRGARLRQVGLIR